MLNRLRRFSAALGSVPSLMYAIIYIAAIPSFALVYDLALPEDFYHSTAQFERGPMELEANKISREIEGSVLSQSQRNCGQWTLSEVKIEDLVVSANPSDVGRVKGFGHFAAKGPEISFLLFSAFNRGATKQDETWDYETFSIRLPPFDFAKPEGKFVVDYFNVETETNGGSASRSAPDAESPNVPDCLFPKRGSVRYVLALPDRLTDDIIRYAEAKRGFPSKVDGQFVRMLYLSATTITTLGLGDIVPLSSSARLAISVEAVTGIVIMGLFLNALARER